VDIKKLKHAALEYNNLQIMPASKNYPAWYKNAQVYHKDDISAEAKGSFKKCGPFTDSFSLGYMMPLQKDLKISFISGVRKINTLVSSDPVLVISEAIRNNPTLPIPDGFSSDGHSWNTKNIIDIPEGYKALITHPLNRYDLPFITLSAVISGGFILQTGNVPFFLKEDFEGTIPAGTPIFQIILFKDEDWVSEVDPSLIDQLNNREEEHGKNSGFYNSLVRKPSRYS
jgi:hypothetical protein